MEKIIEKLKQIDDNDNNDNTTKVWDNWNLEEKKQLLDIYLVMSQKETNIFNLIYKYHGCDSWEDIFRDYNVNYLKDKAVGVEIAIEAIISEIEENQNNT